MAYTNRYFIFGEIVLTFEDNAPPSIKEFLQGLSGNITELAGELADIEGINLDIEKIKEKIDKSIRDELSEEEHEEHEELQEVQMFYDLLDWAFRWIPEEQIKSISNIGGYNHVFIETRLPDEVILLVVISLNNMVNNGDYETGNLLAVAPNWLMVASDPEQSGFGGPGTYPVKVDDAIGDTRYCFNFYASTGGDPKWGDFFAGKSRKEDQNVVVAVLDTYPKQAQITEFLDNHANSFLQNMVDSVEITHTEIAENETILTQLEDKLEAQKGVHAKGHYYKMSSHGLFVTSLIHMIAPDATIKVYRVLNDYGVGTTYTIMRGLQQALEDHKKLKGYKDIPLVINLSLTMTFPFSIQQLLGKIPSELKELLGLIIEDVKGEVASMVADEHRSFECGISRLASQLRYAVQCAIETLKTDKTVNMTIIAAAGNDNKGGETPDTSFPASFKDVIGVAALKNLNPKPKNQPLISVNLTDYSSKADKPRREGFAVFGGDIAEDEEVTDGGLLAQGVENKIDKLGYGAASSGNRRLVGIYIDEFPEPKPQPEADGKHLYISQNNTTGWAAWSGTSFAAPIITGAIAKLVLCGASGDPVEILQDGWTELFNSIKEVPHIVLAMQGTKDADGNCKSNVEPSNDGEDG